MDLCGLHLRFLVVYSVYRLRFGVWDPQVCCNRAIMALSRGYAGYDREFVLGLGPKVRGWHLTARVSRVYINPKQPTFFKDPCHDLLT